MVVVYGIVKLTINKNKRRSKMKNIIKVVCGILVVMVVLSGCGNVVGNKLTDITVDTANDGFNDMYKR